jgi:hypothetical protein
MKEDTYVAVEGRKHNQWKKSKRASHLKPSKIKDCYNKGVFISGDNNAIVKLRTSA